MYLDWEPRYLTTCEAGEPLLLPRGAPLERTLVYSFLT